MKTGIMENWVISTVSSQPLMCRLVRHTCLEKMGDNDECLFVITKYLVIRLSMVCGMKSNLLRTSDMSSM